MTTGAPAHILVIDDDVDFLEYVGIVLRSAGYLVETATNAERGLQAMQQTRPDLVIADVMMSMSMDGLVIDHQMAQSPELRDVPLLMVSAIVADGDTFLNRTPETRRYAGLMRKPLEPTALLKRVADLVADQS